MKVMFVSQYIDQQIAKLADVAINILEAGIGLH